MRDTYLLRPYHDPAADYMAARSQLVNGEFMPSSPRLARALVDVAMGRRPADTVIRNARWVCVQSGEVIPHTDAAIVDGHFAYVGPDARHCVGKGTRVIAAS